MLQELIWNLITAPDDRAKRKCYKALERVGIDKATADAIAAEYDPNWKGCEF